jgi:hypothetical protein
VSSVPSPSLKGLPFTPQFIKGADLPHPLPRSLDLVRHHQAHLPSCVPPSVLAVSRWGRNINRLCITYAFRPRLSSRLTLGRRALPRKPRASGGRDSHPPFRYSCRHSHFRIVQRSFRSAFSLPRNAPLPPYLSEDR